MKTTEEQKVAEIERRIENIERAIGRIGALLHELETHCSRSEVSQ